ncbi:hypothetical protein F4780DRAFT_4222 [Xylariomycetidae sp. FL0641]|nr:hypothetical protein F4780DRAFT_4222 [Xylariomycetidae sp. FL0641]
MRLARITCDFQTHPADTNTNTETVMNAYYMIKRGFLTCIVVVSIITITMNLVASSSPHRARSLPSHDLHSANGNGHAAAVGAAVGEDLDGGVVDPAADGEGGGEIRVGGADQVVVGAGLEVAAVVLAVEGEAAEGGLVGAGVEGQRAVRRRRLVAPRQVGRRRRAVPRRRAQRREPGPQLRAVVVARQRVVGLRPRQVAAAVPAHRLQPQHAREGREVLGLQLVAGAVVVVVAAGGGDRREVEWLARVHPVHGVGFLCLSHLDGRCRGQCGGE